MRGVLRERYTLVGDVEEDHRCAKDAARAYDLHIEDVGDPHEQKNKHLAADTFEADLAGELLVSHSAHDARDVVHGHENHKSDKQAGTAAEEVAEPSADCRKDELNGVPEFFHTLVPSFLWLNFVYEKSDCPKAIADLRKIMFSVVLYRHTCFGSHSHSRRSSCPRDHIHIPRRFHR